MDKKQKQESRLMSERRTYRIDGITPLLGSQAANPDIRTAYIMSKAPKDLTDDENEYLPNPDDQDLNVFLRDPKTGSLMLMDNTERGFFKAALDASKSQNGIKASAGKVDKYLFVYPRYIDIMRDGKPILEEDIVFERPIRMQTMQGPRTALKGSEEVDDPWSITITVELLPNDKTAKSNGITWQDIELALDYGMRNGLGQFRNGGYGRFTWQEVRDEQ